MNVYKLKQLSSKLILQDTLINLLNKHKLENITVKNLVKEAKLSRQTFYNNYYSIIELLEEIEISKINELKDSIIKSIEGWEMLSRSQYSSKYVISIFNNIYENRLFYHVVINTKNFPFFLKKFSESIMEFQKEIFLPNFTHPIINKNKYAAVQTFSLWGLIVEWDKNEFTETPEDMANQHFEIALFDYSSYNFELRKLNKSETDSNHL